MFTGNQGPNPHRKLTRSSSVTPPGSMPALNVSEWLNSQDHGGLRGHGDLLSRSDMGLSRSMDGRMGTNNNAGPEPPHAPLSPQSSVTSSGSGSDSQQHPDDHHQARNTFLEEGSGMKGTSFDSLHFSIIPVSSKFPRKLTKCVCLSRFSLLFSY